MSCWTNELLDQCGGVRRCTFRLTRGRYWFAMNKSRCHESAQSIARQDALRPLDTVVVRHRSGLSGVGGSAAVRCHESVTSRYVRAWIGLDDDVRKALQINKYRVQRSSGESTSRDLKFAQCRFESDWGHHCSAGQVRFRTCMDVRTLIGVTHIDTTGYNCLRELEWPCIDTLGFPSRSGPAHVAVRPLGG